LNIVVFFLRNSLPNDSKYGIIVEEKPVARNKGQENKEQGSRIKAQGTRIKEQVSKEKNDLKKR